MLAHIKLALRRQSKTRAEKPGRLEHLLGYTIDQLREHLERQFSGSMSWRNQGRWHIDHIRPVKSFQLANEDGLANVSAIRECWALTNLRPLWAKKNMEKGSQEIFLI